MFKNIKKFLPIILIFVFGLTIRLLSTYPANTIIGFDQARDLFDAKKIISGDLRIVGPTAGNNANLHHGVAYLYYLVPPIVLGQSNPFWIILWNSIFNALTGVILYFLSFHLFKNKKTSLITALLTSISFYLIQYSGWLSNPTVTLLTVPFSFLGFWLYIKERKIGLILLAFFLGLSIQFEIFFIYLIPIYILSWIILKPKFPSLKLILLSIFSFLIATSTMVATEIKFKFLGIRSLISSTVGHGEVKNQFTKEFIERFFKTFSETIFPNNLKNGIIIGIFIIGFIFYELFVKKQKKDQKKSLTFLLIYLFSPIVLFLAGYHRAPWYLIGLPPAIILASGYILSKLKNILLVPILFLIAFINLSSVYKYQGKGQVLLEPDSSALLSKQLEVIKYTYQKSQGKPFSINTVTNPLYINAVWAYNYSWYSKNYGYLPSWLGGDQEYPYNTLLKPIGNEEMFFLIVDNSNRIPPVHISEAEKWADLKGNLIETKDFEGIYVNSYSY